MWQLSSSEEEREELSLLIPETPFARPFLRSIVSLLSTDLDVGEATAAEVASAMGHLLVKSEDCGDEVVVASEVSDAEKEESAAKAAAEGRALAGESSGCHEENNNYDDVDREIERIIHDLECGVGDSVRAPSPAASVLSLCEDGMPAVRTGAAAASDDLLLLLPPPPTPADSAYSSLGSPASSLASPPHSDCGPSTPPPPPPPPPTITTAASVGPPLTATATTTTTTISSSLEPIATATDSVKEQFVRCQSAASGVPSSRPIVIKSSQFTAAMRSQATKRRTQSAQATFVPSGRFAATSAKKGEVDELWCGECRVRFESEPCKSAHICVRPHPCVQCGKRFKSAQDLRTHALIHAGKRPHRCDACGKEFR